MTNEDLLAISQLLDGKLKPIKDDVKGINQTLENDVKGIIQTLENDVKGIIQTLENNVLPRLQNIESCYTSTYKRYQSGIEQIEAIQADVDIMKKVITEHSEELQKLA